MEAELNRLLNQQRQDRSQQDNSNQSESDDGDFDVDFDMRNVQDMLVSNEGEWIAARRHGIMRIWKGLKGLLTVHMPEEGILEQASFGIFASFVYRWTNAESDDDSSNEDEGENAPSTGTEAHQQEPALAPEA